MLGVMFLSFPEILAVNLSIVFWYFLIYWWFIWFWVHYAFSSNSKNWKEQRCTHRPCRICFRIQPYQYTYGQNQCNLRACKKHSIRSIIIKTPKVAQANIVKPAITYLVPKHSILEHFPLCPHVRYQAIESYGRRPQLVAHEPTKVPKDVSTMLCYWYFPVRTRSFQ
jgi:hypothetical protein